MKRFLGYFLPCFAIALALLIYPVYVIRPFRHQGPGELILALKVIEYRPIALAVCGIFSIAALVFYWMRERRVFRRIVSGICMIALGAVAALARVNIYEIMFHPFERPAFSSADQVKLDGDEKVIAVGAGKSARAYPIRVISYHHIVNDFLDGEPIVATY